MKKVLSVVAVSAFVLSASAAFAGGFSKMDQGCQEACQQQIDDLLSSQAQQDEVLRTHAGTLDNHETRITTLEKPWPWYVRLGIRAAWMDQTLKRFDIINDERRDVGADAGFGAGIAIGRKLDSPFVGNGHFRVELELAYQSADLDEDSQQVANGVRWSMAGDDYSLTTVMLNGYYEHPIVDAFAIYGMAGAGYAYYDVSVEERLSVAGVEVWRTGSNWSKSAFAYKLGAGVTYNFDELWAVDLGYEYLGVADSDIADSLDSHNVVLSVRFMF